MVEIAFPFGPLWFSFFTNVYGLLFGTEKIGERPTRARKVMAARWENQQAPRGPFVVLVGLDFLARCNKNIDVSQRKGSNYLDHVVIVKCSYII